MMTPLFHKSPQVFWNSDVVEIVGFGEVVVVFKHEACFWTQEKADGDTEVKAHFWIGFRGEKMFNFTTKSKN
jgi:hypothetical protein